MQGRLSSGIDGTGICFGETRNGSRNGQNLLRSKPASFESPNFVRNWFEFVGSKIAVVEPIAHLQLLLLLSWCSTLILDSSQMHHYESAVFGLAKKTLLLCSRNPQKKKKNFLNISTASVIQITQQLVEKFNHIFRQQSSTKL